MICAVFSSDLSPAMIATRILLRSNGGGRMYTIPNPPALPAPRYPPASGTPDRSFLRRHVCPDRAAFAKGFRDPLRCEKYFVPTRPPLAIPDSGAKNRKFYGGRSYVGADTCVRGVAWVQCICRRPFMYRPAWEPCFGTDRLARVLRPGTSGTLYPFSGNSHEKNVQEKDPGNP